MKIALIPQPLTNDIYVERKDRERLRRQISELRKTAGNPENPRVACSQRRLAREISYLVVEEFGDCPTIIYPWLNEENLPRLNKKHLEAVCEFIKSQNSGLLTIVLTPDAFPIFVSFFNEMLNRKDSSEFTEVQDAILLIDTESQSHFIKIS